MLTIIEITNNEQPCQRVTDFYPEVNNLIQQHLFIPKFRVNLGIKRCCIKILIDSTTVDLNPVEDSSMSANSTLLVSFYTSFTQAMVDLKTAKNGGQEHVGDTILQLMLNKYKLESTYQQIKELTILSRDLENVASARNICQNQIKELTISSRDLELVTNARNTCAKKTKKQFTSFQLQNNTVSKRNCPSPSDILNLVSTAAKQQYLVFGKKSSHSQLEGLVLDFPCAIEFRDIKYPSALHAFMAQTFENNLALQEQCAQLSIDALIKLILVQGNPNHHAWYRVSSESGSEQYRERVIYDILHAKFDQNPTLKKILLATLNTALIYRSGVNKQHDFWGTGARGTNLNKLGQILMKLREKYGGIGEIALSENHKQVLDEPDKTGISALDKSDDQIAEEIAALNAGIEEKDYQLQTTICRQEKNHAKNCCNDYNYVYNQTLVPLENGNYINANWMHESSLIGTQAPKPNTAEDFWHMVFEQGSPAVVMLNLSSDPASFSYYPNSINEPKSFGEIQVSLLEEPTITADKSWNQSPFEEEPHAYKKRILEVKKGKETHRTTHYQYMNWRDMQIGSEGCVAHLIRELHDNNAGNFSPTVVHCFAGVGRTGTFAAIYNQYCKWKAGGEVNIPECIKQQRSPSKGRFPLMTQSPSQYNFCYSALRALVKENSSQ